MIDVDRGPRPDSLDRGYEHAAFREELCDLFLGKCYLTEVPITAATMNVDHRVPKGDGGGVDEWTNLFPIEAKANSHRKRKAVVGGMLSPGEGADSRLVQKLELAQPSVRCLFAARDPADVAATNAADELNYLHHQKEPWSTGLRQAIHFQLTRLLDALNDYYRTQLDPASSSEHGLAVQRLRILLSRRSPFTALLRSYVPGLKALFD